MTKKSILSRTYKSAYPHLVIFSLAILFLAGVVFISIASATGKSSANEQQAPISEASLSVQGGRSEINLELRTDGFTPAQIQHSSGAFGIAVENKTLNTAYTLRLKAADGTTLYEVGVQKGSTAWTVNLQSGEYTIAVVDQPQWNCHLSVQ